MELCLQDGDEANFLNANFVYKIDRLESLIFLRLLEEKKQFVYCIIGKKAKKSITNLKEMLGEPKEIIRVDTFQYPVDADVLVQPSLQPTKVKVSYGEKVHRFLHT